MVGAEAALEIRVLHRHGKGIREIAREVGVSRNTVRRYLRDESAPRHKARPARVAKLDPFKRYVIDRLRAGPSCGLPGQAPEHRAWVKIQSAKPSQVVQDSTGVDSGAATPRATGPQGCAPPTGHRPLPGCD